MKNKDSILNARLNLPTIIATIFAAIPAAFAAEGSAIITKTLGFIADFVNVGLSDVAHSISYNIFFPFIYGWINKEHYSTNGKFDYSRLYHDIFFKMLPAGWITAIIFFHVPRNFLQFWLIKMDFDLWASSVIADLVMLVVYLPIRNLALKYIELLINFVSTFFRRIKNR